MISKVVPYINLHTHHPVPDPHIIQVYNRLLPDPCRDQDTLFSSGLHPWHADLIAPAQLGPVLDDCAKYVNLVAFGETGLDGLCKVPIAIQMEVFEIHLQKAAIHRLPVLIHCVKAWQELQKITIGYPVIKIVHGYNGSPELTDRLLNGGFCFSVGRAVLNPGSKIRASISRIPVTSLFCETDESDIPISEVYGAVARSLSIGEEELKIQLHENFLRLKL